MSQILGLFYHLIALALVTKNVKAIKFEGVWDDLESKKFPQTATHKIFENNSSFHVK